MNPVLLLIDLQNDFLNSEMLEPTAGLLVHKTAELLTWCRSRSIPVIHVHTIVSRESDERMPHWKQQDKWICVQGTSGCRPPEPLKPLDREILITKTSFSGFANPQLRKQLAAIDADAVFLAGVHLHGCVRATALDAYQSGFRVTVIEDCVASDQAVHAAITREYLSSRAMRFIELKQLKYELSMKRLSGTGVERKIFSPSRPSEELSPVRNATEDEITRLTADSKRAWKDWRNTPINERAEILLRLATLLRELSANLVEQMAYEVGKPVRYGGAEIERGAALLENVARFASDPLEIECESKAVIRRRPLGVVALITPWNNPVAIPIGKIAPAILYGNTVVWKPAPAATAVASRICKLFAEAGIPPDVLALVSGDSATAATLMRSEAIDAITLSGSLHAGYSAQAISSARMIPFQGELGGNNASIVWPDSDLQRAAELIAEGAFGFSGQRCTANRRAIVHAGCYDDFLSHLDRAIGSMIAGDPFLPDTQIGPVISTEARVRIETTIDRAARNGARIVEGSPRISGKLPEDTYAKPVVVFCENPRDEIVQQETFGPVLVIQKANTWEHALELCNRVKQGLVAALFSGSPEIQRQFLQEAVAGILKINRATSDAGVNVPFGGWKHSGVGPPEHGPSNREFYTRTQAVYR